MTEVTRFPVTTSKRIRNEQGQLSVSCEICDRWLRLNAHAQAVGPRAEHWVFIDVMTGYERHGSVRKLGGLCIPVEALERVLARIERTDD